MKLFVHVFAILAVMFFISCGDDNTDPQTTENETDEDSQTSLNDEEEKNDVVETDTTTDEKTDEEIADESETESDTESDITPDQDIEELNTKEAFMKKVEGRYGHYDIVAYEADVALLGKFKNLIISYGYTELKIVNGELQITDRFCHSEQISNQDFTPTVPDSLTQAIIPDSTIMEIRETEKGEFYLWRPETPTLLGIKYDDPYNTPLPEKIEKDDPRLVDSDNDGKPGVTVYIEMMGKKEEIYIARREIFAFEAFLQENKNIKGVVHDRSEQLIIDATNFLLKQKTDWVQHKNLELSPIYLVPIDNTYDCVKIMEERDTLFPPNPPVWED